MLNELRKILNLNTEFSKNVLTLVTGTTVAQVIPIAISPILTRIYSPEDFGVLALFMSISLLIGTVASARYEQAILLPKENEEAISLIILSFLLLFFTTIIAFIIIILFHPQILSLLNNDSISRWLYFIPVMIFFLGSIQILNVFATRLKEYNIIAKANVFKSILLSTIQIIGGVLKVGVTGLISGQLISTFYTSIHLLKRTISYKTLKNTFSVRKVQNIAKRYHRFPKYSVFAIISNTLTQNVMNISVSTLFSITTLGFYSFANKIIAMPIHIIGNSIGQVFYQQASQEQKENGNSRITFKAVLKKLAILSFVIFIPLYFVIEEVFAFVFSEEWRVAGQFAKIVIPIIMIKFIVSPLSTVNNIFQKQFVSLFWQVGLLVITLSMIIWASVNNIEFVLFISRYVKFVSIYYLILIPILYNHSCGKNWLGRQTK